MKNSQSKAYFCKKYTKIEVLILVLRIFATNPMIEGYHIKSDADGSANKNRDRKTRFCCI